MVRKAVVSGQSLVVSGQSGRGLVQDSSNRLARPISRLTGCATAGASRMKIQRWVTSRTGAEFTERRGHRKRAAGILENHPRQRTPKKY
jgi:hypothetical protein